MCIVQKALIYGLDCAKIQEYPRNKHIPNIYQTYTGNTNTNTRNQSGSPGNRPALHSLLLLQTLEVDRRGGNESVNPSVIGVTLILETFNSN